MHEIVRPDVVPMRCAQSHTRPVIELQTPLLRLLSWNPQPFSAPQPLYALVVDLPARVTKKGRDTAIAISTILPGKFDHVGNQLILMGTPFGSMTLCRAVLAKHAAGSTFGDTQLAAHLINAASPARRAQKFPLAASFKINLSNVRSATAFLSCSFSF